MTDKIESERIKEGIKAITLYDMEREYDPEKLILGEKEGVERDLACWLVKTYYTRRLEEHNTTITDNRLLDRVLSEAKWYTINHVTNELPKLIERTKLYLLMEAEETAWYRKMEYKDIAELMMSMANDEDTSRSEMFDLQFIAEKMVPAAKAFGIDPTKFGNASHQLSKLRQSLPAARLVLKKHENGEISDEKARDDLQWIISEIADQEVSQNDLQPKLDRYRGITPEEDLEIKGHIYMTGDDTAVVMIETNSRKELRVVEQRLKNRVDLSIADYKAFAEQAAELLTLKE